MPNSSVQVLITVVVLHLYFLKMTWQMLLKYPAHLYLYCISNKLLLLRMFKCITSFAQEGVKYLQDTKNNTVVVYNFNNIIKTLSSIFWIAIVPSLFITGSNQPPRFLNYFFSTYLLIYEDTPVGESLWSVSMLYLMYLHCLKKVQWSCLCGLFCQLVNCTKVVCPLYSLNLNRERENNK